VLDWMSKQFARMERQHWAALINDPAITRKVYNVDAL
jgi:hypothetical protein